MEQREEFSDEVNLLDYLKVIWKNKKLIIIILGTAVLATTIISLVMTPIYEARTVIAPATQNVPTNMGTLAAQFGMAIPTPSNVTEIVNLLNSNILMEKVIKKYNLLPVFFKKEELKASEKNDGEKIWEGLRALKGILKVNFKQKDNVIEISAQFKDPKMAANIVNYTLEELSEHMSSEAKRVAETNRKYLESQLDKTSDPFIKTKIYNLIVQQIEQAMMAGVKENFAFKVLDPPKVPDMKIKPKRRKMVVLSFVVSLFSGIFVAFFKEYLEKVRARS